VTRHSQGYPHDEDDDLDVETLIPSRGLVSRSFAVALLVGAFATTGLFFALRAPQEQSVPVLVGVSLAKARTLLMSNGLALIAAGSKPDSLVVAGSISLQDPVAGRRLPTGGAVIVLLSAGVETASSTRSLPAPPAVALPAARGNPPRAPVLTPAPTKPPVAPAVATGPTVKVPKVRGIRLRYAVSRLRGAGLVLGNVSYRTDEDHMPGFVLKQNPAAGTSLNRGSKVELVVNRAED